MARLLLVVGLALVLLPSGHILADQKPSLQEALALEEAMQKAIQAAEPSIACVLVSRSPVYRTWFGDEPTPDRPGKLGEFDPNRVYLKDLAGDAGQLKELLEDVRKKLKLDTSPIAVERELKKRFDLANPTYVPEGFGSGVVIDGEGLILTNYHVVRDAVKIYVRLPDSDGKGSKGSYADIHAADPRSDLAVLKVLNSRILPLPAMKMGDGGAVRKGQFVLSIANPFAAGFRDGSPSASWGIISNVRRRAPLKPAVDESDRARLPLSYFGTLLQTDARLNLGCSGGALIDLKGEMIGLTTALAGITGGESAGGFAVPMDAQMQAIVSVLAKGKEVEYGFLGVGFPQEARPGDGVQLDRILVNSPAARAGLRRDDIIVKINGLPVRDNDDLFLVVGMQLAGTETSMKVRSPTGINRTVIVKLAKFHQPPDRIIASNRRPLVHGLRVDWTSVLVQRDPFFRDLVPEGVYVSEVEPDSPADRAHLQNAVITRVNGRAVNDPDDFYRQVDLAGGNGPLELTIAGREGGASSRKVTLN